MEKMITYGIKYKIVRLKSKNFYTRCEKVTLAVKVGASLRKQTRPPWDQKGRNVTLWPMWQRDQSSLQLHPTAPLLHNYAHASLDHDRLQGAVMSSFDSSFHLRKLRRWSTLREVSLKHKRILFNLCTHTHIFLFFFFSGFTLRNAFFNYF